MKKNVMFVATTPFAVNAFLSGHLLALAQRYEVILCVDLSAYELSPELAGRLNVIHVDFCRKVSPLKDLRSLWQLTKAIREVQPVAIHSIMPKSGLLTMLAGAIMRVPHRWHTFTGQVWANKSGWRRAVLKVFDRLIVGMSTRVFADSPSQCRLLREERIVGCDGVSVLGGGSIAGVDLARFRPNPVARAKLRTSFDCKPDACIFLYVGRIAKDKGVFDLLEAFRIVSCGPLNVELWFVGPDEEGLWARLNVLAKQCTGPVRWLGKTRVPEHYMAAADVQVLASYREGFGSVLIEAAACGLPAIAYRIDGVIDAVADGLSGVLVTPFDIPEFASAMGRLAADRKASNMLGTQAHTRAQAQFCSQTVTESWLEHYAQFLDCPS